MSKAKKKTLLILLIVLAAVGIAAFAVSRHEEKKEEIKNSEEVVLSIAKDDVTALSWEYDETSLAFHKDEDSWKWDEDDAFPVDSEVIESLLEPFESFSVSFAIDNVTDESQYGLDDPTAVIHITAGEEEYEITLGTYSTMDEERYVSIGDGKVYLVTNDPMEDYELTIEDMIKNDEIPSLSDATKITFSGDESYEIDYLEDSTLSWCADDVYFTEDKPLDTDKVTTYLSNVHYLSLGSYATYNATEEELKAYGLDEPELSLEVVHTVTDEDSEETHDETFVCHVGRNQEELEEALEKVKDEEDETADLSGVTAYVRIGDSQIVYEISNSDYTNLMAASYNDLRHKEIVTASFDDIEQMDISLEGETYTMTAEKDGDDEAVWHYGDSEALDMTDIKTALAALTADSFTSEAADGKEEIGLTLHLNNESWPEITISLTRYDGEDCLAEVNGESVALVPRSQVVDLIEAVNAIILDQGQ